MAKITSTPVEPDPVDDRQAKALAAAAEAMKVEQDRQRAEFEAAKAEFEAEKRKLEEERAKVEAEKKALETELAGAKAAEPRSFSIKDVEDAVGEPEDGLVAVKVKKTVTVEDEAGNKHLREVEETEMRPRERGTGNESAASTKIRFRIVLPRSGDPLESPVEKVGVNGRVSQIKRGEQVDLPPELVLALRDAIQVQPVVGEGNRIVGYREAQRFPFQILGMSVDRNGQRLM